MNDKTPQELMEQAMIYHRSGRLADAEPLYRQVLATNPNASGALHLLGLLAFQSGRPELALDWINRAIALNPVSPDYHLNRGVVLDNTGHPQEAINAFKQSITLRPDLAEAHANLGNALRKVGRCPEAVAECKRALELKPDYVEAYTNLGNALLDMGAVDDASAALQKVTQLRPDFPEGRYNLGNALARRGRLDEALAEYETALKLKPDFLHVLAAMGQVLTDKGRVDEAIAACRKALQARSDFLPALMNLSQALRKKSELENQPQLADEAIGYMRQAAAAHAKVPEVHLSLGLALHQKRLWADAAAAFRQALSLRPGFAEALCGLGNALGGLRDWDGAADAFRQAVVARPEYAEAFYGLGLTFCNMGRLEQAVPALRRALALRPDFAPAYAILGVALSDLGEVDEAIAILRQAAALLPAVSSIQNNLGVALRKIAQFDAANACFERAIALDPAGVIPDSNRVYALYFHSNYDSEAILREHQLWNQRHAEPLKSQIKVSDTFNRPDRRLRVGYVSPDFREHCQSLFTTPLLANHDHQQFEIFCYADVPNPDPVTERLRTKADHWRPTTGMDDQSIADLVRNDQIDILVDLTMHMLNGRPLVFARKPAPVQVTWLAYPGTTGMTTIDARLTDPHLDPPGEHDAWYSEPSLRLPNSFWCYDPMGMATDDTPIPDPGELPALKNGHITFGCLNNFFKMNDGTLKMWSAVLNATPASKLRLLSPDGDARRWVIARLTELGIAADRVDFVPYQSRRSYMAEYHHIDIGLDTIPYNGHTTSLDAMYMGVPVVTRVGRTVVGRAGLSQLSNLKLTELIAWDDENYLRIVTELAADLPRLTELRSSLRDRMRQSPLMDGPKFARSIEAAYRQLWNQPR